MDDVVQWFAVPAEQAAMVAVSVGLAALIRAFTGFGFAMLVVPVFSVFLIPGDAVVLSSLLAFLLGLISSDNEVASNRASSRPTLSSFNP